MKTKRPDPALDAVAIKRAAQAELLAKTRGMTHAEEIAFYEREAATGPLAAYWRRVRAKVRRPAADSSPRIASTRAGGDRSTVERRTPSATSSTKRSR